jgi:hypothetical protein
MGYELQTTDDLLTHFKRDSYIAASQGNYTDPQLLAMADVLLLEHVFPLLKRLGHGWYGAYKDVTLLTTTNLYALPRYAMAGMVEKIELVDATSGAHVADISPVAPGQAPMFENSGSGTPSKFTLMHNVIRLNRTPASSDTTTYSMRVWFWRRPGRMVQLSAAAKVLSQNGAGVVTFTAAPPATFLSSTVHDFYRGEPPFNRLAEAASATAQAGSTQTFATATAALLQADDYVCLRDETVFPDLPIELYPHLMNLMDARLARAKGDVQAYAIAEKAFEKNAANAIASAPGSRIKAPVKVSLMNSGLLGGMGGRKLVSND